MYSAIFRDLSKNVLHISKQIARSKHASSVLNPNLCSVCQFRWSSTNHSRQGEVEIYNGTLTTQIRAVKVFSLTTSFAGLMAQPILVNKVSEFGVPITATLFGFVGFFTFVTPFFIHLVTKKYVTKIIFNSVDETYKATIYTFFLRKKQVVFTINDVIVPDVPGLFTTFNAKGIPLFVDPQLFEDPNHYAKIMGYDKPLDLKLGLSDKESK